MMEEFFFLLFIVFLIFVFFNGLVLVIIILVNCMDFWVGVIVVLVVELCIWNKFFLVLCDIFLLLIL